VFYCHLPFSICDASCPTPHVRPPQSHLPGSTLSRTSPLCLTLSSAATWTTLKPPPPVTFFPCHHPSQFHPPFTVRRNAASDFSNRVNCPEPPPLYFQPSMLPFVFFLAPPSALSPVCYSVQSPLRRLTLCIPARASPWRRLTHIEFRTKKRCEAGCFPLTVLGPYHGARKFPLSSIFKNPDSPS